MNSKLFIGRLLNQGVDKLIAHNYKLMPFIPNGRIMPLDLKRAHFVPETILDVGANIGQTAIYFNRHFPDANIYCFEPVFKYF